jgi:hypothetical protein
LSGRGRLARRKQKGACKREQEFPVAHSYSTT